MFHIVGDDSTLRLCLTLSDKVDPMSAPVKPDRKHTVIWSGEDWERLEAAARVFGQREHMDVAEVDIIRSGARRLAEEILASAESAA